MRHIAYATDIRYKAPIVCTCEKGWIKRIHDAYRRPSASYIVECGNCGKKIELTAAEAYYTKRRRR